MASLPGQDAIALMRSTASLHYLFTPTLPSPSRGRGLLRLNALAMALGWESASDPEIRLAVERAMSWLAPAGRPVSRTRR